jgi:4-hydroxy-3-polyprenylbenzoate decarboxylase
VTAPRRLVIAITGASGAIFGIRALELLRGVEDVETHVVVTRGARRTILEETDHTVAEVCALADHVHAEHDLGAAVSSGSFRTDGMLVAPCSIKTLSAIVNCYADNLVVRAADVTLKEGRKLVLLVRETPMHKGHLRLLLSAAENGATIMPPVPAFYHRPDTIEALVDQTVGRALDQFGFDLDVVRRWREPDTTASEQVSL